MLISLHLLLAPTPLLPPTFGFPLLPKDRSVLVSVVSSGTISDHFAFHLQEVTCEDAFAPGVWKHCNVLL